MNVIVKPLGLVVLCTCMTVLSILAFRNKGQASGTFGNSSDNYSAVVYDDVLHRGWTTDPWAKLIEPSDTSTVHNGHTAIKARIDHYLGVRFTHAPMGTARYDRLCFFLNGGRYGGQSLHVQGLIAGAKTDQRVLLNALPAKRWVRVVIPLAELKVDNKPDFNQFWIQDVSGRDAPECFLDDVRFLRPGEPEPEGEVLETSLAPRENW